MPNHSALRNKAHKRLAIDTCQFLFVLYLLLKTSEVMEYLK